MLRTVSLKAKPVVLNRRHDYSDSQVFVQIIYMQEVSSHQQSPNLDERDILAKDTQQWKFIKTCRTSCSALYPTVLVFRSCSLLQCLHMKRCLTTMLVVFVALFYCVKEISFCSCGALGVVLPSVTVEIISRYLLCLTNNVSCRWERHFTGRYIFL